VGLVLSRHRRRRRARPEERPWDSFVALCSQAVRLESRELLARWSWLVRI
jgi:hypothetical protein